MEYIKKVLDYIDNNKLYPDIVKIDSSPTNIEIVINKKKVTSFCSNDYLGLANSEALKKIAIKGIKKYGIGSGGSRLISGNTDIQMELEQKIANFKGQEAAITFATGYMANSGVIPAIINASRLFPSLIQKKNVIFSDEFNHASIIDGCRLSYAEIVKYKHKDMDDLEKKIKKYKNCRKMLITDSVFSMDGDIAPIPKIVELAKKYNILTMIDDAHASGVLGKNGRGGMEYFNLKHNDIDLVMGTFTKAFGGIGGFVVGTNEMIRFLRVNVRTYIFTAPIIPAICASLIESINRAEKGNNLRKNLWSNVDYLKSKLNQTGFNTLDSESQIMPVIIGDEQKAVELSRELLRSNYFAPCVRWPAVQKGHARLRVTVKATHTKKQIDGFASALIKISKKLKII